MAKTFNDVDLTPAQLEFTNRILSSDALAAQLVTRIKQRIPTAVVRMSDGERGIIEYSRTGHKDYFLKDPRWLSNYGLAGADLAQVGRDLLKAGNEADYLGCTISGVFWDIFDTQQYFPDRSYCDCFYPFMWECTGRVGAILKAGPCLVLHNDHRSVVRKLSAKYGVTGMAGMRLSSWDQHDAIVENVKQIPASTVLVSGGASGKALCVRLAKLGKVALDVGSAMTSSWANTSGVKI